MRIPRSGLVLVAGSFLLSGCGLRAQREALRSCSFTPRGATTQTVGDSLMLSVAVEIRNPGPATAVLDSFSAIASSDRPLARLSHGSMTTILPGHMDTAQAHLMVAKQGLIGTALALSFSPPDSILIEGTAWVPGVLWGTNAHALHVKLPFSAVSGQVKALMPGL